LVENSDTDCSDSGEVLIGGPADPDETELKRRVLANSITDSCGERRLTATSRVLSDDTSGSDNPWSAEGLRGAQRRDKDIGVIVQLMLNNSECPPWETVAVKSADIRVLWRMWPRLSMIDGLLKRRFESADGSTVSWQMVMPAELRQKLLEVAHGGMTGGHLAKSRTAATIQSRAYWPTWSSDLDAFLRACEPCARYHRGSVKRRAHLQTPLVGEPWARVSIDITGPHPRSSAQHQYILTLVDHFSKWAEAIPIHNHTAPTVARALITNVFSRYGAPGEILSDLGPEFQSTLFTELLRWMEINQLRTTAYKPSTNGTVERFHRTLNSMLGKVVKESQRDWHERLPLVMAAYRSTVHEATGFSPNRLFLGRETRMPLDLIMGLPADECRRGQTTDEYVQNIQTQMEVCYETARKHLRAAAERRKATYDINVKKTDLSVGDWVWYHYPRRYKNRSQKWQKHYTGPYLIIRMIEPVNCVLQKSQRTKPFVVHVDKIKKCYGNTPVSWLHEAPQTDETTYVKVPVDANPSDCAADNVTMRETNHQLDSTGTVGADEVVNGHGGDSHGRQSDDCNQRDPASTVDNVHHDSGSGIRANRESSINCSSRELTAAEIGNRVESTNSNQTVGDYNRSDHAVVGRDGCGAGGLTAAHRIRKQNDNNSNDTLNHDNFNNTFRRAKRDRRIPARFVDFVM